MLQEQQLTFTFTCMMLLIIIEHELGQVWYLIVSIPDLCALTYFKNYDSST